MRNDRRNYYYWDEEPHEELIDQEENEQKKPVYTRVDTAVGHRSAEDESVLTIHINYHLEILLEKMIKACAAAIKRKMKNLFKKARKD